MGTSSLREHLGKVVSGELVEEGEHPKCPQFNQEEMKQCVAILNALVQSSKRAAPADRVRPPSAAIPLIL
jgi:hypothetical protein